MASMAGVLERETEMAGGAAGKGKNIREGSLLMMVASPMSHRGANERFAPWRSITPAGRLQPGTVPAPSRGGSRNNM